MIRFLQADSRAMKVLFYIIIAACSVGMVVYLIPGLFSMGAPSAGTYAVVYPHWYSHFFSSGSAVTQQQVEAAAQQAVQQQGPQYAGNAAILKYFEARVGTQLVEQQVLMQVAQQLGVHISDDDVSDFLHQGQFGQALFPNGNYVGDDAYANFVATRFNMSVDQFQGEIKSVLATRRLEALITAPVTVGEQAVRAAYMKQNLKIKFDYAVITADSVRNEINPSDSQLQAWFKQNAARYANAAPEERAISYFAFTTSDLSGGVPQPTQQQIEQYYNDHKSQYTQPEEVDSRHILISVGPKAAPQQVSAAQAKAESILKQLKAGANFAEMAKKYSDDPGSKDKGGELGFVQRGTMVPTFDNAIFTQPIGALTIVKSEFGFHIVQVEARHPAHEQALNEVLPEIQATLIQQQTAAAESQYAQQLSGEAQREGLAKTAAAHHLQLVTTPPLGRDGKIAALPDSSQLLTKAFSTNPGDPPQAATTGEGYAILQVKSIVPAHAPTFAEWKDHVLSDYRDQQVPGLIDRKTKELADKAQSMNDLGKAAKAVGAKVETSDLVTASDQVPDLGQMGQAAPQLFKLNTGNISGPIDTPSAGIVAKIVDKQEPSPAEMAKNLDQTREAMLEQQRDQAFDLFVSNMMNNYRQRGLIRMGKLPGQDDQGM